MLLQNPVLTAYEKSGVAFGTFIQINSPENCEIAAKSGLDFTIIDMEHGTFGIDAAVNMIRAAEAGGAAPFVRIADYAPATILKVLDAGAVGIVVPGIETAQQLKDVIAATRYAPEGTRGACPCVRATGHGLFEWSECTRWASKNIMVVAIVETSAGIANFEELVRVEGLSGIAIGQFDLSQSMGYQGDHEHPEVLKKQAELAAVARQNGVDVMGVIFDADPVKVKKGVQRWTSLGARLISVSGDRFVLASAYNSFAAALELR